jgi:hypothetical protein
MRQTLTAILCAVASVAAAAATGCNDPRYAERLERRSYRIDQNFRLIAEREGSNPERIYFTLQVLENIETWRREYRQSQLVGELAVRDFEKLPERSLRNQRYLGRFLEGDPQRIEDTLPKIVN